MIVHTLDKLYSLKNWLSLVEREGILFALCVYVAVADPRGRGRGNFPEIQKKIPKKVNFLEHPSTFILKKKIQSHHFSPTLL